MGNATQKISDGVSTRLGEAAERASDVADRTLAAAYKIMGEDKKPKEGVKKPMFTPAMKQGQEQPTLPDLPEVSASLGPEQLFEEGKSLLEKEPLLAGQYFAAACDKGMGKSCLVVAEMWKTGVGQPPNPKMAAKAFEHACAKGEGPGCYALGEFFLQANTNHERAAELFEVCLKCGLHGTVTASEGDGLCRPTSVAV